MDVAGHGPGIIGTVTSTPPGGASFRVSNANVHRTERLRFQSDVWVFSTFTLSQRHAAPTLRAPADNFAHSQAPPPLVMKRRRLRQKHYGGAVSEYSTVLI